MISKLIFQKLIIFDAPSSLTGAKENVVVNTKLVDVNEHKAETAGGKGRKRKRVPVEESEEKKAKRKRQEERVKAREEKQQKKKERRLQTEHKKAVGLTTRATFNWAPEEDSLVRFGFGCNDSGVSWLSSQAHCESQSEL